jgi:uncharacterized protein (TIGR03435 family)
MSNWKKGVALAAMGIVAVVISQAQTIPKFDLAAIKPCEDTSTGRRGKGGTGNWSPGRLTVNCQTVMSLIQRAYVNFAYGRLHIWPPLLAIEGGPAWINSASYQIEAKSEGSEGKGMMNGPMLQTLLEDRFRLKVHRETREMPVYALTVAKGGPKLQPFREGSCVVLDLEKPPSVPEPGQPEPSFCGMSEVTSKGYKLYRTTLAEFATEFSDRLERPVIDKTGIAGVFDIELDLTAADLHLANSGSSDLAPGDDYPVFDAVRNALRRLGLNLESTNGPGEFLVIDSVERPSAN